MKDPLKLARTFDRACVQARLVLCDPVSRRCMADGEYAPNSAMVGHCHDQHGVDLVRIRGAWWLVPRK